MKKNKIIYEVRGEYVILDLDISRLCGIRKKEIKRVLNEQKEILTNEYCFKLVEDECLKLNVPIGTKVFTQAGFEIFMIFFDIDYRISLRILKSFSDAEKYIKITTAQLSLFNDTIEKQHKQIDMLINMCMSLIGAK